MTIRVKRRQFFLLVGLIAGVWPTFNSGSASAQTVNRWTNNASGFWTNATSWSLVTAPNNTQGAIFITNANNRTVTFDAGAPAGNRTISNLTVSGPVGTVNTLQLTNAPASPLIILNGLVLRSGGALLITNSVVRVDGVSAGEFTNDGSAVLVSGSLAATNRDTSIGVVGNGSMTLSNGVMFLGTSYLGAEVGSSGTLTVAGGTNQIASLEVGFQGAGTIWVTGGRLVVPLFPSVVGEAGAGQMTTSNGTVLLQNTVVGNDSTGTLTVAGGTNEIAGFLGLGVSTGTGFVWMKGGRLTVLSAGFTMVLGSESIGQMTVSNGVWLARDVFLGHFAGSEGTLTVIGGTNNVYSSMTLGTNDCSSFGVVTVAGGRLFVTNSSVNALLEIRSGTLTLNSGTLTIDKLVITNACGHFARTGGTLILHTPAVLASNRDDDADGIANGYEQSHGLDPLNPADANVDSDGDGLSNLQEFLAGTDATNSVSSLRITAIAREGNNIRVTWMTGIGKTNALQRTAGDPGGNFTTNNFAAIFTVTNTVGTVTNYLDLGAATNMPAFYYRVRLVP